MDRFLSIVLLASVGVLTQGCQRGPELPANMPDLHPVKVTVLQEGTPLPLASVRLIPQGAASPWSSGGSTDEQGVAVIRTHGRYEGAPAGNYKVTITKIETPQTASADLSNLNQPVAAGATYDLVSPEYTYPNRTPLELKVDAGTNAQEFDLGPAVRIPRKGPPS